MRTQKAKSALNRGKYFENNIAAYLQSLGFATETAAPVKTMYRIGGKMVWRNRKVDFFGCLDILGIHPNKPYFLPIQATISRGELSRKRRDMSRIKWNLESSRPQIWIKGDGTEVSVFMLTTSGWQEFYENMRPGFWMGVLQ